MDFQDKEIPKEFKLGDTTVRIHSRLAWMTDEEQRQWFKVQREQGNPVLRQIDRAIFDCQRK